MNQIWQIGTEIWFRTDNKCGRTEWTDGQRQNYIPPTLSGDNYTLLSRDLHTEIHIQCVPRIRMYTKFSQLSLKLDRNMYMLYLFMYTAYKYKNEKDQQIPQCNESRTLVKSEQRKFNFLISQPKHMSWVLKWTVSMRRFFWAPKTYAKIDGSENIYNFTLNFFLFI